VVLVVFDGIYRAQIRAPGIAICPFGERSWFRTVVGSSED
jgi:hypothetical protein